MPWCEDCNRYWSPPTMGAGGECPTCGRVITQVAGVPWHFKLLVAAVALYLGYRAWQGLEWVVDRL